MRSSSSGASDRLFKRRVEDLRATVRELNAELGRPGGIPDSTCAAVGWSRVLAHAILSTSTGLGQGPAFRLIIVK